MGQASFAKPNYYKDAVGKNISARCHGFVIMLAKYGPINCDETYDGQVPASRFYSMGLKNIHCCIHAI